MQANVGFQFYNGIYDVSTVAIVSNENRITTLLKTKLDEDYVAELVSDDVSHFILETTYPGLLIGSGLAHGVNKDDNDFKIGFSFDHTTGLPIISGSSVKGCLRSMFPNFDNHKNTEEEVKNVKASWLLKQIQNIDAPDFLTAYYEPSNTISLAEKETIVNLENEIFDGKVSNDFLSIYYRDIFMDAHICGANSEGYFLGTDYITPHLEPLKNPKPIKFIKILPNVAFLFQFDLKDGKLLSKKNKNNLFHKILLTIGIGAKTNVGYGQFKESII
jgi:CRISPR-associated protein Cmr6